MFFTNLFNTDGLQPVITRSAKAGCSILNRSVLTYKPIRYRWSENNLSSCRYPQAFDSNIQVEECSAVCSATTRHHQPRMLSHKGCSMNVTGFVLLPRCLGCSGRGGPPQSEQPRACCLEGHGGARVRRSFSSGSLGGGKTSPVKRTEFDREYMSCSQSSRVCQSSHHESAKAGCSIMNKSVLYKTYSIQMV